MNLGKKEMSQKKATGNCMVLRSEKSSKTSPARFLESGAFNQHSDTKNDYDYTYIYDTEGRR